MGADYKFTLPNTVVTPDNAPNPNEYDVDALTMSLGGNKDTANNTQEYDVHDLTLNSPPYIAKPEESSVASEWGKRIGEGASTVGRHLALALKGAAPTLAATEAGFAAGGPVGGLVGSVALPFGDLLNSALNKTLGTNLGMPSEIASRRLTSAIPEATTQSERLAQTAGTALGGTASELSALSNLASTATSTGGKALAKQLTEKPVTQLASSAPISAGSQYVGEETNNPLLGLATGILGGAATGLRATRRSAENISHEDLLNESTNLYNKAKQSGIQFNQDSLANKSDEFAKNLRTEGYTPKGYPRIESALEEMKNPSTTKDYTELSALRKMIQGAQSSTDPDEKRIASILKDHFDDYVLNAPETDLITASPQGLQAWKEARSSWSKLKKAEIFDDMHNNAELNKSKFTASGAENSYATDLRNLAKNKNKMRLFTSEEQDAINEAAKGGGVQNVMKFIGRFAPTGVVSGMAAGFLANAIPQIGIPAATAATVSRRLASLQRKQDVTNLADMMRLGRKPELESRLKDLPTQTIRGAVSSKASKSNQ